MTMTAIATSKKVSLPMPVVEVRARVLHGIHTHGMGVCKHVHCSGGLLGI